MTYYEGRRDGASVLVTVNGLPLDLRLNLRNHSPTGFEWGYGGSGPSQLALAILAHHCRNDEEALNLYQRFKWVVIAELTSRQWILTGDEIDAVLKTLREAAPKGGPT